MKAHNFLRLSTFIVAHFLFSLIPASGQPQGGIIAYYPLDGHPNDLSGNSRNGTVLGNVGSVVNRYNTPNSAYHFDGTTARIRVPFDEGMTASHVTVSAWVKIDQFTNHGQTFVTRWHNGSENNYVFALEIFCPIDNWQPPFTYPNFAIGFNDLNVVRCRATTPIELGVWTHLCGTFDGVSVNLYVNGALVRSMAALGALQQFGCPLSIGGHDTPVVSYRNFTFGSIDEVYVYNRALTQNEVLELYGGVTLTHPNGGEELVLGTIETIRWQWFAEPTTRVAIKINYNFPFGDWEPLFMDIENTGRVEWFVNGNQTTTARMKVVSATNPSLIGYSASNFSIVTESGTYEPPELPSESALCNFPNPFNASTTISYSIPIAGDVTLKVFDLNGREIQTLFQGNQAIGNCRINFDGSHLSTGTYFVQLQSSKSVQTQRMVLLK